MTTCSNCLCSADAAYEMGVCCGNRGRLDKDRMFYDQAAGMDNRS